MPWVPFHEDDELFDEERGEAGFVLDNDVDLKVVMPWLQGNLGLSVIALPPALRRQRDPVVLKFAKDRDRLVITHDGTFVNKRDFDPGENPGVIVIPGGGGDADRYLPVIREILLAVSELRHLFSETVTEVSEDGRITVWTPDFDTDTIERFSIRVRWDAQLPLEVWVDPATDDYGYAPPEAWDEPIK
jgi:predicted nuclease of predicted toxin-antitoxin system